jgi:hypothetical protein
VAWGAGTVNRTVNNPEYYPYHGQSIVPEGLTGVTAIAAGFWHTVALVNPTAPDITTQPVDQAVNVWRRASFTVAATGFPLNYQWRKDGVDIAGATRATYSLPIAQTNQAGSYTVVVSNSTGSVTSAPPAVLTITPVAAPGTVIAWGVAAYGPMTTPLAAQSGVVAIAAGDSHTVALKNDATVIAWGHNSSGQVTGIPTYEPTARIASPVTLGGQVLSGVTAIEAGDSHTVALKNDGSVVAWGYNENGQVTGTPSDYPFSAIASPVTLGGQVLSGVTAIAVGGSHTVALKDDGSLVAWGVNYSGQVTGTPTFNTSAIASPVTLGGQVLSGVTAIAAGDSHTVALKNDGTVIAWGRNSSGQVTGTPSDEVLGNPVTLGGQVLSGVTAIAAGGSCDLFGCSGHTAALKDDGTVIAWGRNSSGQVTETPSDEVLGNPVTLGGQVLSGVTAIAAGGHHTVALFGTVPLLPSLNARPNGNELILSWPTNAVGFALQSTPNLTPPVTWIDSTIVPTVIGSQFRLTNTTSGGARFYRLERM